MTLMARSGDRSVGGGFTLIEILVAVTIVGLIGTMVFGAFSGALTASDRIAARSESALVARFIASKFFKDVQGATLLKYSSNGRFVGINGKISGEIDADSIAFTSYNRASYFTGLVSDQALITWRAIDPEPASGAESDLMLLERSENAYIMELDDEESEIEPRRWIVTDRLKSWNIRYYDKASGKYSDEIEITGPGKADRLPTGLELKFELLDLDGQTREYSLFALVGLHQG